MVIRCRGLNSSRGYSAKIFSTASEGMSFARKPNASIPAPKCTSAISRHFCEAIPIDEGKAIASQATSTFSSVTLCASRKSGAASAPSTANRWAPSKRSVKLRSCITEHVRSHTVVTESGRREFGNKFRCFLGKLAVGNSDVISPASANIKLPLRTEPRLRTRGAIRRSQAISARSCTTTSTVGVPTIKSVSIPPPTWRNESSAKRGTPLEVMNGPA